MRLIPVMLALLLALSPGAVALQASAPTAPASDVAEQTAAERTDNDTVQPAPDGNTTSVMTLGTDPTRAGFHSPSLSLGDSLTMDRDGFRTQLSVAELDQQLASAETDEDKKRILNRYRFRIENQIISLQAKEERVTSAFSNGTISEREYLRTLGQIDAKAAEIETLIDALKAHGQSTGFGIDDNSLKTKLTSVQGPVRDQIAKATRGSGESPRVYVETTNNGVVLSTIIDGTYVREILRSDRRDPSQTANIGRDEVREKIIRPQYPWIVDNWTGSDRRVYPSVQVIRFSYTYSHGSLTAYVDTGTESVFREIQHKRLTGENSLPPRPGVVNSSDNVTLTVNRTYPGGPLRVQLTNETGAPLRGQITVAGEPVGRTNAEGVLWTLGPAEQFAVSATHEDAMVNVTATPVDAES